MDAIDLSIVVAYLLGILLCGLWVGRKTKSSEDYFVAGRKLPWYAIGASLYAANINAEHFVGALGTAYMMGIAMASYEWLATFALIILAFLILPFFLRSRVSTSVEYLEKRFGPSSHLMLAVFVLIMNVIGYIPMYLYAGSLLTSQLLGIGIWEGVLLMAVLAGIYTTVGGLKSVVWTNLIQAVLITASGLFLLFFGLQAVGGWGTLRASLPDGFFHLVRPVSDPDMPWPGVFIGISIINVWYWCLNPNVTQSALGAKDSFNGKMGVLSAGFFKLLTPFLFIFPGLCAAILYPGLPSPDLAGPTMISELLPVGVTGLFFAGFIASVMSSVAATLQTTATIISNDVYRKYLRKSADDKKILWISRITTFAVMVLGILFVAVVMRSESLFIYIQQVSAYITPGIVAVFLFGMLWKDANAKGSFATMTFGLVFGISTWLGLIPVLSDMAYLHFCIILFAACCIFEVLACKLFREKAKVVELYPAEEEKHRGALYASAAIIAALTILLYVIFG
jgi:SSS family solute:Na+ symporter